MSHNTWIHRGVRALVRPLVKTRVTPNHLTTLRLAFGIGAAAAFAVGSRDWQVIGAGIFVISLILDRADGELARQSGKTSPWGHTYDLLSDSFSNAIAFVGIGIGASNSALGGWTALLGLLAGGAIAAILWMVVRVEAVVGARAAELSGGAGFDPDDAMLVVPVVIWLDGTLGLLYAAAVGAPAFAIFFYLRFRSSLRRAT